MLALAAACSGSSKKPSPTAPPLSDTAVAATPTALPVAPPLAEQIGVRASLPPNRQIELAARYGRTPGLAPLSKPFAGEASVGDHRTFSLLKLSGATLQGRLPPTVGPIDAVLLAKSAHAYFYEDSALKPDPASVQEAADMFEATVWPIVTGVFGEPAIPGVDGDPRIIVLQADLGGGSGGYYNSDDLRLRAVSPYSNEAEMVYIDRTAPAGGAAFNVILAHEFQHLIHAKIDPDEDSWVNEGLSETASGLVGGAVSTVNAFEAHPETQLNGWAGASLAHYGAGAAFFRYLASRFGGDASLGAIAREQGHGAAGVDAFLASIGQPLRFRDVFADWVAANILNREAGPYGNPGNPIQLRVNNELAVDSAVEGEAHQFGTDYYALSGFDGGDYVLRFDGRMQVPVLPTEPPSGAVMLWANAEDSIDTRLTREVDLTGATEPVLTFRTWYDIERWYDWGYVSVSIDGGATWRALPGNNTTLDDPVLAAYGPGYSGKSGGSDGPAWVDERVSLAAYAGQKVLLRFEYITDGGTHGEGWAIDNVAIEGTSFRDPTLTDPGWRSEGWVRIDRPLPQTYVVRLIVANSDGTTSVTDVPLDAASHGELRFPSPGGGSATLAIAGSTEGTNQTAPYTVSLQRP